MIKKAGIRFDMKNYVGVEANLKDLSQSTVITEVDGVTTEYSLASGGYNETLLWTNPNPGTGFNVDMPLIYFNSVSPDYSHYKIKWKNINNSSMYGNMIVEAEDLINGIVALGSTNEEGIGFARMLKVENIEVSSEPPLIEEWLVAKGLCSEIAASNEKKIRSIPIEVYGVTIE